MSITRHRLKSPASAAHGLPSSPRRIGVPIRARVLAHIFCHTRTRGAPAYRLRVLDRQRSARFRRALEGCELSGSLASGAALLAAIMVVPLAALDLAHRVCHTRTWTIGTSGAVVTVRNREVFAALGSALLVRSEPLITAAFRGTCLVPTASAPDIRAVRDTCGAGHTAALLVRGVARSTVVRSLAMLICAAGAHDAVAVLQAAALRAGRQRPIPPACKARRGALPSQVVAVIARVADWRARVRPATASDRPVRQTCGLGAGHTCDEGHQRSRPWLATPQHALCQLWSMAQRGDAQHFVTKSSSSLLPGWSTHLHIACSACSRLHNRPQSYTSGPRRRCTRCFCSAPSYRIASKSAAAHSPRLFRTARCFLQSSSGHRRTRS